MPFFCPMLQTDLYPLPMALIKNNLGSQDIKLHKILQIAQKSNIGNLNKICDTRRLRRYSGHIKSPKEKNMLNDENGCLRMDQIFTE